MGNSPSKTTQSTTAQPWAPAQPALQQILGQAQAYGSNPSLFTPETSAQTPLLQQAVANSQNPTQSASTIDPLLSQTNANYTTGANTLGQIASSTPGQNPQLDAVLQHSNQLTADAVNNQFSAAGRYGSGAQTTALANSIGAQNNSTLANQYNIDQTNKQNAATTLTGQGVTAAGLAPSVDAANLAQQNTGIVAGQQLDQNATAAKQAPLAATSWEAGLAQPIAASGGTTNSSGTQLQQSNPVTTGLGLGLAGLSLFSDEKAKENIREVGKTHDGQKIYSYNYKGDPRPTMGLIAQEVEKKHPEAVGSVGGMKTVNYRQATRGAARGPVKKPSPMGMIAA